MAILPVCAALVVPLVDALLLRVLDVLVVGGGRLVHVIAAVEQLCELQKRDAALDVPDAVRLPKALLGVLDLAKNICY